MNSIKNPKSGLLWLFICTFMAFIIKSSNAQNNTGGNSDEQTIQNQLIPKENKTKGGFCKGKATEKMLKSELDRILDKKKYDIRILDARQFLAHFYSDRPQSFDF